MPRGAGVGNADTVQQRGRFFGYKRAYLGLLRIFLERSVRSAFERYVDHEQSVRQSLIAFRAKNRPLSEWRRSFFLDRSMSPTRSSVLALDYYVTMRSKEWTYPRRPQAVEAMVSKNRATIEAFVRTLSDRFIEASGSPQRTQEQRHLVAPAQPLVEVYRDLLVPLEWSGDDLVEHLHLLLQLQRILERDPNATCDVYQMSAGARRERGLDSSHGLKNLMQGENAKTGYPGDREVKSSGSVTVQLHRLRLTSTEGVEACTGRAGNRKIAADDVPVLAVAIPEKLRTDVYAEPEP
jgi:hypothetical protein